MIKCLQTQEKLLEVKNLQCRAYILYLTLSRISRCKTQMSLRLYNITSMWCQLSFIKVPMHYFISHYVNKFRKVQISNRLFFHTTFLIFIEGTYYYIFNFNLLSIWTCPSQVLSLWHRYKTWTSFKKLIFDNLMA